MSIATLIFTFGSGAFAGLMVGTVLSRSCGAAEPEATYATAAVSVGLFAVAACLVFASS